MNDGVTINEGELREQLRASGQDVGEVYLIGLADGALLRARRHRRVRAGVAAASLVAAALVVGAGVPLLGGSGGTATVGVAAPGTSKSVATGTGSATGVPSGTDRLPGQVEQGLNALFPAGSSTTGWTPYVGVELPAFAPVLSPWDNWQAGGGTELTTAGGKSSISFSVNGFGIKAHCPSHADAPYEECTMSSVNGGTLMVSKSFKNPVTGTGFSIWTVSLNGPGAKSIMFSETADAASRQALTIDQVTALVTAPVWDGVRQSLPAVCPLGVMADPHQARNQEQEGVVLVCATSRAAALPTPATPS